MRRLTVLAAVAGAVTLMAPSTGTIAQTVAIEEPEQPPPLPGLQPLAGLWERRDFFLAVFENGSARARWKKGACLFLILQPEPCDRIISGRPIYGGYAEIVFIEVAAGSPAKASGFVTVQVPGVFQSGVISLVKFSDDLALLEQPGERPLWVCRPPRDLNACGP